MRCEEPHQPQDDRDSEHETNRCCERMKSFLFEEHRIFFLRVSVFPLGLRCHPLVSLHTHACGASASSALRRPVSPAPIADLIAPILRKATSEFSCPS